MKSRDNKMFVPFILTFEKGKPLPQNATYYLRVVNRAALAESTKKVADHKAAVEKAANLAKLDPENTELAEAEAKLRAEGAEGRVRVRGRADGPELRGPAGRCRVPLPGGAGGSRG